MRPAFLVGLDFEAAILRKAAGTSCLVAVARQGDVATSRARLEELIAEGADAVVSFGIAGALDPGLEPGSLAFPESVLDMVAGGKAIAIDAAWRSGLAASASTVSGKLACVAAPVTTPAHKARLHSETGAVAVDMESAIAGRLAAERGLPFLVVRVIADDARLALPAAALAGIDADGRMKPLATTMALIARPGELFGLIRLARATAAARRRLATIAPRLVGLG